MGFVQFYFGLPIAMVVICVTFIPLYHKYKVYTAYEYLEKRFDLKRVRLRLFCFVSKRTWNWINDLSPAIILSAILGWNLTYMNIIIGVHHLYLFWWNQSG
jgi:uncharacterized sodium:solute symporter family permease YidK